MSDRVLRAVTPPALALLVAVSMAVATSLLVAGAAQRAGSLERDAIATSAVGRALDDVRLATLGYVASGVGSDVVDESEIADSSAAATAAADAVETTAKSSAGDSATASAASGTDAYLAAVKEAAERSRDSVDLGNSLAELDDLHQEATDRWDLIAEVQRTEADEAAGSITTRLLVGGLLVAVALAAAGILGWFARRRLITGLDRPVHDLREAAVGVATPGPLTPAVQGFPELVDISADLVVAHSGIEQLRREAAGGERDRRVLEALALAEDERGLQVVAERALAQVDPTRPVELLMSEPGSPRLSTVASNPDRPAPGCLVATVSACTAARRGQVSVFDSSDSIDACPYLRDRIDGACSAVCVPVTVAGRPAGVLHMTGEAGSPPPEPVHAQLVSLATSLGARYGALRTLENTRIEAATDGLTGLPNRRAFESAVADLIDHRVPFVMVLADLDKFKRLNDSFGHEVGDRALQLFSGVLRDNVRGNDIVARLGGEEFVLVYPSIGTDVSLEAIGRLREALVRELVASPLPEFTCSFGIARSTDGVDSDAILRVADAGLLRAKELGGDQAVVADLDMVGEVFSEDR